MDNSNKGGSTVDQSDPSIRPFRIEIPQNELDGLRNRLAGTRWPDELPDAGWRYGVPREHLKELTEYWRTSYDWRKYEAQLNQFPQFTTTIDGANVHFLHVRSPEKNATPLILTHGWPGSIVEFLDVIGPLTDPRANGGNSTDAFHLVIPSIPGYGFSGTTREAGWNVRRIAFAWSVLMKRLGYVAYGAQGGDWGSAISRELGGVDPEHVIGVHVNYLPTIPAGDVGNLSEEDKARLARLELYLAEPAGYMKIQASRPQTLAYGLTDSPVGQLAWIAEKFNEWIDPACRIEIDRLLTNVMIYWLTGTAGSSARLYYESAAYRGQQMPCPVPVGVAVFPHDLVLPVRRLAERKYKIVHWTEFERGGHFPAIEAPDLIVRDLRTFFRRFR
ncbi:epoxide hydrolase family protein [Paenibacillus xerothermodurans]|uniref:Epoxide hydrolase n=1 Tax=Paenibacillus xerothermodurans TaxID=1977292 RepID=A0A2W1NF59_PAEXE|nr:epoxide hydrolase family protein [Paenibacillus xerothermodurans]PZE21701.1 epoxide hydrolase [Paenibacillus xerothermodurans]